MDGEKADSILPVGANNTKTLVYDGMTYNYTYEYDSEGYPLKGVDGFGDSMEFVYE
ncbi:hypothetical protein [Dysgonomonas sp. Marseille-P4361]|uniref:hypothetical protein n=1 Tax=Dysgonomonas sp. Marseille-P4361 TaxID=2161820 RepID=UPI0013572B1A|nr:hypothetical protein [Dysgonomonas sp. Marseille-P4361]